MAFSQHFLEELKARNRIDDVIGQAVTLKRAGSNMMGLCPFHNEKTPSFTVFTKTDSFYCFGCGAGGDVVTFVMQHENVDYPTAVELLANRCGLPMEEDNNRRTDSVKRDRIIEMNKAAARFFHSELYSPRGKHGLEYLRSRGLNESTIKRFGLGFAPSSWGSLSDHLKGLGFNEREMTVGFLAGSSGTRVYDYFRNRVMFPIIDISGNVVAFGGRVMGDEKPKYLNSSDTPAFKKSRNLFALNYAKKISNTEGLILCEGYMDVISLHQAGFNNAVATLGTAITPDHAKLISKFTDKVFLAYDSDEAGKRATQKAISILSEVGINVGVIDLGTKKDPDEFIKANGRDAFSAKLRLSTGRIDYQINEILKKYNLISSSDDKQSCMEELTDYISKLYPKPTREIYSVRASELLGLSADGIKNVVEIKASKYAKKEKRDRDDKVVRTSLGYGDSVNSEKVRFVDTVLVEERILGVLILHPEFGKKALTLISEDDFNTEFTKKVFNLISPHLADGSEIIISGNEQLTISEQAAVSRYVASRLKLSRNDETVLMNDIKTLKEKNEKQKLEKNAENDMDALGELLKRIKETKK